MSRLLNLSKPRKTVLTVLVGLLLQFDQVPQATAQGLVELQTSKIPSKSGEGNFLSLERRLKTAQNAYILGPGDSVLVELLDVPEYSGIFTIGPDGTLFVPRLRSLFAEGLTVDELRRVLTQQFSQYVRDPQVFVKPSSYRPIRAYIGGEVARPGYYYLSGRQSSIGGEIFGSASQAESSNLATGLVNITGESSLASRRSTQVGARLEEVGINAALRFPTVFDALRIAGGVTPFSKLSEVTVTRKRALSSGGGKMRTKLNFLELITEGNETQNIRLFDGDAIVVSRSPVELREQIVKAGQTNLSPDN